MTYERRVQKSFGQSSSQKKHSPIVPPLIEQQIQPDSQPLPKVNLSKVPSKEKRDAIRRKIFDTMHRTTENQGMREGLLSPTIPVQKTAESVGAIEMPIQAKLTIGSPGDKYEQEADRVAAEVVNQINAPVAQQSSQNFQQEKMSEEEELMMKPDTSKILRQAMPEEEEELQMKPMVQLQSSADGMIARPEVETSIQQARGGGQSLADNIREPLEQAFGADFSRVKVHTDQQSNQLNQSIQARAFTTGQDVFFRSGEYNPRSREGQELLAHELTHVVQQEQGSRKQVQRKPVTRDGKTFAAEDSLVELKRINGKNDLQPFTQEVWDKIAEDIEYLEIYYVGDENKYVMWDQDDRAYFEVIGNKTWRPGVSGYNSNEVDHYRCNSYDELVDISNIDAGNMGNVKEEKLEDLKVGFYKGSDIPPVEVIKQGMQLQNGKNRYILSQQFKYTKIPVKYV